MRWGALRAHPHVLGERTEEPGLAAEGPAWVLFSWDIIRMIGENFITQSEMRVWLFGRAPGHAQGLEGSVLELMTAPQPLACLWALAFGAPRGAACVCARTRVGRQAGRHIPWALAQRKRW